MQWDDSKNAGFSTNAKVPVNSDYTNINWKVRPTFGDSCAGCRALRLQAQYKQDQSSLKMFSKLSKLRTRDEALSVGGTLMGRLVDGGAFTVVRFHQRGNVTIGHVGELSSHSA